MPTNGAVAKRGNGRDYDPFGTCESKEKCEARAARVSDDRTHAHHPLSLVPKSCHLMMRRTSDAVIDALVLVGLLALCFVLGVQFGIGL